MAASQSSLTTLGIGSRLQRMQLLNRRDELLIMAEACPDVQRSHSNQVSPPCMSCKKAVACCMPCPHMVNALPQMHAAPS